MAGGMASGGMASGGMVRRHGFRRHGFRRHGFRRHGFAFRRHRRSFAWTVALERAERRHRSTCADEHNPATGRPGSCCRPLRVASGMGRAVGLIPPTPWLPEGRCETGALSQAAACSDVEGGWPLQRRCPSACGTVIRTQP